MSKRTFADWQKQLQGLTSYDGAPPPGHGAWNGKDLIESQGSIAGPCPICGGNDRFNIREGDAGGAVAWCRNCGRGAHTKEQRKAVSLRLYRAVWGDRKRRRRKRGRGRFRSRRRRPPPVLGKPEGKRYVDYGPFARRCAERLPPYIDDPWRLIIGGEDADVGWGLNVERLERERGWLTLDAMAIRTVGLPPNGWPRRKDRFPPRLLIPYRDREGRTVSFRWRAPGPGRDYGNAKAMAMIGQRQMPYGLDAVKEGDALFIAEGEKDAESIREASPTCSVIGMPGANPAKAVKTWAVNLAAKLRAPAAVVCFDGDDAGRAGQADLIKRLRGAGIPTAAMRLPEEADMNDWLLADRAGLTRTIDQLRRKARRAA